MWASVCIGGQLLPAQRGWSQALTLVMEIMRLLPAHAGNCDRCAAAPAMFHLATDLPAALLARMLGIHISVAVAWQRASGGDWTTYAADVSRRTTPDHDGSPATSGRT